MIRPIDMQMLLPRTESVGNVQQHEIQHTHNVNVNAANEAVKQEQKASETVVERDEKQYDTYRYDAKDQGGNQYKGSFKRKKKKDEEKNGGKPVTDEENNNEYQPRIDIQI